MRWRDKLRERICKGFCIKSVDILVIGISSPFLVGVYEDDKLIQSFSSQKHISEALIEILGEISSKFNISSIIYTNTPGSFMGLKVSYVILKTFCVAKNIDFFAVSGFELNNGGAIRANKSLSFVLQNNQILLKQAEPTPFKLPLNLSNLNKTSDTLPSYIIQAV